MNLEAYYNDVTIRLTALITLGVLLSGLYLIYLRHSNKKLFLKQKKDIYILQFTFWGLYLGNIFGTFLPSNYIGFFIFELILLGTILMSLTFLLWRLFSSKQFSFSIFFLTLPLMLLFIFALGHV